MKYLLDTCTVSDFVKGQPGVLARIKATPPSQIAVSVITRMEIEFGLQLNPERARKIGPVLDGMFNAITTLALSEADAIAAAAIRAALQRRGQPIGPYDILIAGCGLAHGLIVVTSNTGEFERVGGLLLENWR
ncbi:MAG: type II toxin-antitoxin system VapC family toxin [Dechloromonas sp.]|nr:MAG: type II toxin-antitoxin system VapC family toxin [Dechloromonas sp.]